LYDAEATSLDALKPPSDAGGKQPPSGNCEKCIQRCTGYLTSPQGYPQSDFDPKKVSSIVSGSPIFKTPSAAPHNIPFATLRTCDPATHKKSSHQYLPTLYFPALNVPLDDVIFAFDAARSKFTVQRYVTTEATSNQEETRKPVGQRKSIPLGQCQQDEIFGRKNVLLERNWINPIQLRQFNAGCQIVHVIGGSVVRYKHVIKLFRPDYDEIHADAKASKDKCINCVYACYGSIDLA
jgi:hypothetical protein